MRGPEPRNDTIKKQHVGKRRGQIAHKALAVAPEPVKLIGGIAPTVALPGLQCDPGDPPRLLADRRFEFAWKVLARGHVGAAGAEDGDEKLGAPQPVHAKSVFVIF